MYLLIIKTLAEALFGSEQGLQPGLEPGVYTHYPCPAPSLSLEKEQVSGRFPDTNVMKHWIWYQDEVGFSTKLEQNCISFFLKRIL